MLRVVREDVYAREGVWDLEKVSLLKFLLFVFEGGGEREGMGSNGIA